MKTTVLVFLTTLAPMVSIVPAHADDLKPIDVKVGLWETTSTTEISGMPAMSMPSIPEDKLAQLPPEQRARIEAMMKGRGGAHTNTARSCITREKLEQGMAFNQDKACTYKVTSSSSSKQEIHMECSRENQKTTGDIVIDRVDSEHVKGSAVIKGMGSAQMNMKMSFNTKFISSDCGDVKPSGAK